MSEPEHNKFSTLLVWGYHGTLRRHAEAILENGFELSQNPWDWLGDGVYFWQDAPHRAGTWGDEWARKESNDEIAVIRAKIRLEDCMDLLDTKWMEVVRDFGKAFATLHRWQATELRNKPGGQHDLDAAFFNYLVDSLGRQGVTVNSIRAAIAEGDPILEDSPIRLKSHVQIAVRDLALIEDMEIV